MKNKKMVVLVVIALVLVIGIVYVIKIRKGNNETTQEKEESVQTQTGKGDNPLIDMSNTENVEIQKGEKINTSKQLKEEKNYKNMTVKDISLKTDNGVTQFTAVVENNSGKTYEGGNISIIFTDSNGTEIGKIMSELPEIENGDANSINSGTTADLANAYDFRIE